MASVLATAIRKSGATGFFHDVDDGQAVIVIPAVVVAEVIMVVQKGRLSGASLDHLIPYLHSMNESENYPLAPLLPKTVIASHEHTIIPDIFDRLIVTEAILKDLSIITRDQTIRESGLVSTIWD
jgi:PIN domain nuclease of toxin-antitoxin system